MADKQPEISEHDLAWIDKQDADVDSGKDLLQKASHDALEYIGDVIQNLPDKQWRKMAVETEALEIGIGQAFAEHLVPTVYRDMEKNLHKRLKVSKSTAEAIRHIYIGRVIKNLVKELNNRERNI